MFGQLFLKRRILSSTSPKRLSSTLGLTSGCRCSHAFYATIANVQHHQQNSNSNSPTHDEQELFEKYKKKLESKGIKDQETLKQRARTSNVGPRNDTDSATETTNTLKQDTSNHSNNNHPNTHKKPPKIKSTGLSSILDVEKTSQLSSPDIESLWTTYHQNKPYLSAVLPSSTFTKLQAQSKKYPVFVLPLVRDQGIEMMYLQISPSAHEIHFTPLLEFKTKGEFARPLLCVTHYTEFMDTHGIVLMRGEVDKPLSLNEGQHLVYLLHEFYVSGHENKRNLLKQFHEQPGSWDVNELVEVVGRLE